MWYIVLSRMTGNEETKQLHTEAHRNWLEERHRAGQVLFSGPTANRSHGIYILLASSRNEAEQLAAQDPYHIHRVRTMEVLEWEPGRAFRMNGPTIAGVERMATGK